MTTRQPSIVRGDDGVQRCWWCVASQVYIDYHDREWGRPSYDDRHLFEHLCLEGFQAGLSWITILRKRNAFRTAFADFDVERVARFNRRSIERLLRNERIVRNRLKIESAVNNARRAIELAEEFGSLSDYFWRFAPDPRPSRRVTRRTFPATSRESVAMSKDLKMRGWKFVGPTGIYAFMQSCGLVNDHVDGCEIRSSVKPVRRSAARPVIR